MKTIKFILLLLILTGIYNIIEAQTYKLYEWNHPDDNGTTWEGWTYSDPLYFGSEGWVRNDANNCGTIGLVPRMLEASNWGNTATSVDPLNRAPSTDAGSSLKFTAGPSRFPGHYYILYDHSLSYRGMADATTDRWSMYIKVEGIPEITKTGTYTAILSYNFNFGTYLTWGENDEVCQPTDVGGGHFYHWAMFEPGTWIHVEFDRHPNHQTSNYTKPIDNPTGELGYQYYNSLHRAYFEFTTQTNDGIQYWVDEVELCSTADRAEPNQNDISISAVWVGYWAEKGKWQISWQDISSSSKPGFGNSVFDVRWSPNPITNENFETANKISPEFYAVDKNLIRKHNPSRSSIWTQFELPVEIENKYGRIFFAIKDVSEKGKHIGSSPYHNGDFHDAPSHNIHTIDYYLRPTSTVVDYDLPPASTVENPTLNSDLSMDIPCIFMDGGYSQVHLKNILNPSNPFSYHWMLYGQEPVIDQNSCDTGKIFLNGKDIIIPELYIGDHIYDVSLEYLPNSGELPTGNELWKLNTAIIIE